MKRKLITVCWISLGWLLIALYQYVDSYVVLLNEGAVGEDYNVSFYLKSTLTSVFLGSLVGGSALVFLWEKWLRVLNFKLAMLLILLCYSVLYFGLMWISIESYGIQGLENAAEFREPGGILFAIFNPTVLPNYLFWLGVMLATLFLLFVRDRFGPGMLGPYLTGKYFRPKSEERVVMFLDLKDSTQIAERLGAERYFSFLNEVFQAVTSPILDTEGEIYQYVGDEVVLTWDPKSAAKEANCVRCFEKIARVLAERSDAFLEEYGFKPSFKAGLNAGTVVAGEVGVIKREVVYSGDVLNTAARIRGLCTELQHDLLVSESVVKMIEKPLNDFRFVDIGAFELRGKMEPVNVYSVLCS